MVCLALVEVCFLIDIVAAMCQFTEMTKKENAALTCFAAADDDDEDDDDVLSWLLLLNKCVLSCLLNVVMPTSLVPLPVFFSLVVLISKQ